MANINEIKEAILNANEIGRTNLAAKGVEVAADATTKVIMESIENIEPRLEELNAKPDVLDKVYVPSTNVDGFSSVNIEAVDATIDENITPENIKEGVTILGVEGTHAGGGGGENDLDKLLKDELTSYRIPDGVKKLRASLFENNVNLANVDLNEVYNIGKYTFQNAGIKTMYFNNTGNTLILGQYAFQNCDVLETVEFEEGLNGNFGSNAFYGCNLLKTVLNLPSISSSMFYGCISLENVTFSDKITKITSSGFSGCKALKNVVLNSTITTIENSAFQSCEGLTQFTISNPSCTMTTSSFTGCKGITDFIVAEGHNQNLYLDAMTALTHDSLVALINNLGTVSSLALKIGSTNIAKLTAEEIAVATNKGWTVS